MTASASAADFSCIICYDQATEPVVTKCGHLFCWACLDKWLVESQSSQCPICQGLVRRDVTGDIIPLYGKGKAAASRADGEPAAASPRPSHASGTHPEQGGARPQANREQPPPQAARDRQNNFQWNIRGGGGGVGFLFFAPQLLDTGILLFAALCICLYYFFPWNALRERWYGRNGGHAAEGAQAPAAQNANNNARFDAWSIFVVVSLFSCAALVNSWLSTGDDGEHWTL